MSAATIEATTGGPHGDDGTPPPGCTAAAVIALVVCLALVLSRLAHGGEPKTPCERACLADNESCLRACPGDPAKCFMRCADEWVACMERCRR